MPVFNSSSQMAKGLKGLHLFHFTFSNCSQRVRLALAEKGLPWVSHHLDLSNNEHVTPEYQALNPKGVVPTLVNNGEVVVESNDILLYLEEKFPEPALVPEAKVDRAAMEAHIHLAGKSQDTIKALSFDILLRQFITSGDDELRFLQENRHNKDIVQFMEDFHDDSEAWAMRVERANKDILDILSRLDKGLENKPWLSGEMYGLADISWIVNIHRLNMAGFKIDQYPSLNDWFARVSSRKAFSDAVVNYQPEAEVA
jgi:glutathione S-transferase